MKELKVTKTACKLNKISELITNSRIREAIIR